MQKVHIVGGDSLIEAMFLKHGDKFSVVKEPSDADILIFTGGADVSPELYGEKKLRFTSSDPQRDYVEVEMWKEFKTKAKAGICRGGQFLNVMNGGKMYQDVNNHCRLHEMFDNESNLSLGFVTSTHHQMMIPHNSAKILAVAGESTKRIRESGTFISEFDDDTEVLFYAETQTLCFQPHPEYKDDNTEMLFFKYLETFLPAKVGAN